MNFKERRQQLQFQDFSIGSQLPGFNANLFYLTGVTTAGVLVRTKGHETLYLQKPTEKEILFDGMPWDLDSLAEISGLENIQCIDLQSIDVTSLNKEAVLLELAELRLVKDPREISHLRTASQLSRKAHTFLESLICSGASEWDLKVEFERFLFLNGCRETAYGTISAAGENSTLLHARSYNRALQEKDIFLLDGAGKFKNYSSDITSTFQVGDKEEALKIMSLVKKSQEQVLQAIKPGVTLSQLHQIAIDSMCEDLTSLSVIEDPQEIRSLFPHNTSHWIGIEVHDPKTRTNDSERPLQPGMTFTVEPGIYFSPRLKKDYGSYKGLGVRFEEVVLVCENGCEILSRC